MTQMKDSGKRHEFKTGAVRDTAVDKPRPDLISPYADEREGEWMRLGAEKYDERNWEKGIPISRCIASIRRHLMAFMMGQIDEDHMAAVRTNASFILHFEHEIAAGRLPATLDDMPKYEQRVRDFMPTEWLADPDQPKPPVAPARTGTSDYEGFLDTDEKGRPHSYCGGMDHAEPGGQSTDQPAETTDILFSKQGTPFPKVPRGVEVRRSAKTPLQGTCVIEGVEYGCVVIDNSWRYRSDRPHTDAPTPRPTLYIAGPMRGKPRLNWAAFFEAEKQLHAAGYNTINPARLDQERGIDPDTLTDETLSQAQLRQIVQDDIQHLLDLDPAKGDGVVLLDNWANSVGAQAEARVAQWLRLSQYSIRCWVQKARGEPNG